MSPVPIIGRTAAWKPLGPLSRCRRVNDRVVLIIMQPGPDRLVTIDGVSGHAVLSELPRWHWSERASKNAGSGWAMLVLPADRAATASHEIIPAKFVERFASVACRPQLPRSALWPLAACAGDLPPDRCGFLLPVASCAGYTHGSSMVDLWFWHWATGRDGRSVQERRRMA